MPRGINSIDINTGEVETDFGVVVKYDGLSAAKIWITLSYGGCVEGNNSIVRRWYIRTNNHIKGNFVNAI